MKISIKKFIVVGILTLLMLTDSTVGTFLNVTSSPTLTVFAQTQEYHGGRRDITLGIHSNTVYVTAKVDKSTWFEAYDKNWNPLWSGSFNGLRTFTCGPEVYTVTFYLADDTRATITW